MVATRIGQIYTQVISVLIGFDNDQWPIQHKCTIYAHIGESKQKPYIPISMENLSKLSNHLLDKNPLNYFL